MPCDTSNTITAQDITDLKSDISTIDVVVESNDLTTITKDSKTIDTVVGRMKKLGLKYSAPIPAWSPALLVTDQVLVYSSPAGDLIAPKDTTPFTTGGSFDATEAARWNVVQGVGLYDGTITANYATVALMVADTNLLPGQSVYTHGYISAGDGGGAYYLIAAPQSVDDVGDHTLSNSNVAILQSDDFFNAKQYGAVDGVDSTTEIDALITSANSPILVSKDIPNASDINGTERVLTAYSDNNESDFLGKYADDLYQDTAVVVDCYGDSTMFGDDGGMGGQAATTQPSRLQFFLRAYYSNSAATVNNVAISGTDSQQMLDGTDGSGSTFEARIIATSAVVIYCNHCINDVNVGRSGIDYKRNWIEIIEICRKHGKTPIVVTPQPMMVVANPTFDANSETVRKFVEIQRQVAEELSVPIVDQYDLIHRFFLNGESAVRDFIPDGEHPNEALYKVMGNNLAIPWVRVETKPSIDGFIPASFPDFESTGADGSKAITLPFSRVGIARLSSSGVGTQTIRLAVFIPEAGKDLYLAQILFDEGAALGNISIDFVSVGNLTWFHDIPIGSAFPNDYEVAVARNIPVGLHFISCTNNGAGKLGISYLRTRDAMIPIDIKGTGSTSTASPTLSQRVKMLDSITVNPATTDSTYVLFDDLPSKGLFEVHNVEVDATLEGNQFIVMRGCINSSLHVQEDSGNAIALLAVGLNSSGFLTAFEYAEPFVATVFDAVDRSGVANIYRFQTFGTTLIVFVNGVQAGSALTLASPDQKGGTVGLHTFNTTTPLVINSLSYVYL